MIVDHTGKPDVTESPAYLSFQPVLRLADLPNVWVKTGDHQIVLRQQFPWRDTWQFVALLVALLKEHLRVKRMMRGTGYARTAPLGPLALALEYLRRLRCYSLLYSKYVLRAKCSPPRTYRRLPCIARLPPRLHDPQR